LFDQILDLVSQPPGSLVYHFIILFAVEAAFAIAIGQWMRERNAGTLRLALATAGLLFGRAVLLLASLAVWQGYLPRSALLPPVERFVDTLTIIGLLWMFVTMDEPPFLNRNFLPDIMAAVFIGISTIGFLGTTYYWSTGAIASRGLFNGLWIDSAWSAAQVVLTVAGLVWMLLRIRYVYDPFLKGIILIVLGAASAVHFVRPALGDVASAVRVGQLLTMPMLAAVAYRHVVEQLLHWDDFEPSDQPVMVSSTNPGMFAPAQPADGMSPNAPMTPPESTMQTGRHEPVPITPTPDEEGGEGTEAPKGEGELAGDTAPGEVEFPAPPATAMLEVVETVGDLFSTLEPAEIVTTIPRVVATALRADVCALAIVDEDVQQATILGSYDNIAQTALSNGTLHLADHPIMVNALGRLRQMRLTTERNLGELIDIYEKLGVTHEGPAYVQPLVSGDERVGVLIIGSPYSQRRLSTLERNLLDRLGPLVTAALLNTDRYKSIEEQARQATEQESTRIAELSDDLTAKTSELNAAQRQIEEMTDYIRDLYRQIEEFPQQQQAAQRQIESLLDEINRLRDEAADADRLREELEEKEAELATMANGPSLDVQSEIASLRVRVAQAGISQQEVAFLQDQLGQKAREVIRLEARLVEAQAVAGALRDQVSTSGLSDLHELGAMQARVARQAGEIARLRAELAEAQAAAVVDEETLRAQAEMDRADREAMAQLEAQLKDRSALIDALENQLAEKARSIADLKSHMAEVTASLRSVEEQLSNKTEEIQALQSGLSASREQAQARAEAMQAGQPSWIDEARVEALEAELAEKAAVVDTLEEQLARTRTSMQALETQLTATQGAVNAALTGAGQVDRHDEVIASIAQELRTPVNSIMGYTDLLLRESVGILGPLQRKFLLRVKANTERMDRMLSDLMRIATAGEDFDFEPESVDPSAALDEVLHSIASQYGEKGLKVRLTTPESLPAITIDRTALRDVIEHLLTNAMLASPADGEVRISMFAGESRLPSFNGDEVEVPCLHIAVQDTGPGVAPDDYGRVFQPRYRAEESPINGLGNTGVGLSLTQTLVEAQGGRIWLESDEGRGTTFRVTLPLEPPDGNGSRALEEATA
jgi:signal transduction histidine kinase